MSERPFAIVDIPAGRAMVFEPDGQRYFLESGNPEPKDGKGIHVPMYFQGGHTPLEQRDPGDYPYQELYRYLDLGYRIERAILFFSLAVDQTFSKEVHLLAAVDLENSLLAEEVCEGLRNNLLSFPIPESSIEEEIFGEKGLQLLREVLRFYGT